MNEGCESFSKRFSLAYEKFGAEALVESIERNHIKHTVFTKEIMCGI